MGAGRSRDTEQGPSGGGAGRRSKGQTEVEQGLGGAGTRSRGRTEAEQGSGGLGAGDRAVHRADLPHEHQMEADGKIRTRLEEIRWWGRWRRWRRCEGGGGAMAAVGEGERRGVRSGRNPRFEGGFLFFFFSLLPFC